MDSDVELKETLMLDATSFRLTSDGYLVATPRIARTGIQIYKGYELGRPDMEDVRVYRPEEEVFSHAAMATLAHRPITLDHPYVKVDASNWKEHSIGHSSGDVARDGDFLRVPLVLMDAHAIAAAQAGTSQLSVGYDAKLQWEPGETSDGQMYDAMQTQIRANHIALVSKARGGDKLKIGDDLFDRRDSHERRIQMTERTLNLDGVNIAIEDKDGQILERHLKTLNDTTADLRKQLGESQSRATELQKAIESKDGEIIGLTKKLADAEWTPAKRDEAIRTSIEVFERARRVLGDKLVTDGKSDIEIKREVVAAEIGDEEAKALSDEAIAGVFRAVTRESKTNDGLRRTANALSQPLPTANPSQAAYAKYVDRLVNAHKQKSA